MSTPRSNGIGNQDMATALAALAEGVSAAHSIDDSLRAVTTAVIDLLDGADSADIIVIEGRKKQFRSSTATSALPRRMDDLQQEVGEGPCIDAASGSTVVRVDDLGTETRWPRYCTGAAEAGVTSALSFKLYTAPGVLAALHIFGKAPNAFTDHDEEVGLMLATKRGSSAANGQQQRARNSSRHWPAATSSAKPRA